MHADHRRRPQRQRHCRADQASDIDRIGTDIYVAGHVAIIADGHHLRLTGSRYAGDAANPVYFLGSRAEKPLAPHDMIAYYPGPR
jgi:hypothetical protein